MKIAPLFVIVSGPAASGKSTLCEPLAECLDLPWLSKDGIKAALRGTIPADAVSAETVGQISVAVLLAVAVRMNKGAVLDCVWRGDQADGLQTLPGTRPNRDAHKGLSHPGLLQASRQPCIRLQTPSATKSVDSLLVG